MDKQVFVQNIKKYCAFRGVKPTIACRESGAGADMINQIERRGSVPSVERVQLLAQYLGITTSDLLGEKDNGPTPAFEDEAALDQELIKRLCRLTEEELEKVDAFVQGLLAAR